MLMLSALKTSMSPAPVVRANVVKNLNLIDHDLAMRVARPIGIPDPAPATTYNNNKTFPNVGSFGQPLLSVIGLQVDVLASTANPASIAEIGHSARFLGVNVASVAKILVTGVNTTYLLADAVLFNAVIVADAVQGLFNVTSFTDQPMKTGVPTTSPSSTSTYFPAGRPLQILVDAFKYGKPVAALGSGAIALTTADISPSQPGVYVSNDNSAAFVKEIIQGLYTSKFLDRFALESY